MTERRQERKVVTVLFCDLVGFTQRAEEMDPEDVASLLEPYHARLKQELERHGGTVEKFIGDAVVALYGAPLAHEDDPERAVRAALAIRDFADEEGIELRIGITTGEALVTLGARPEQGETMATGDVVNTAARLQAAAPVNGVLVSEKTHEATKDAIEYDAAEPVSAKGKSRPVPVWRAVRARSRIVLDRLHATPLVGREQELDALSDALARARSERQTQLVTLVGVPGMGKSRLVYELSQAADRDPELISWRQGRCLPYGDGVTFWALGEIVKAHAGILETDAAELAQAKLAAVSNDEWVREELRPLVGLGADGLGDADRREEAFAAWRRFLEEVAAERPLIVVFEDLHWADENLLDFVDHLVDWAAGVALLVVCTARPELLERRPGWGGGKTNALAISLSPLSNEDTARLVGGLLDRAVMPAETQDAVLVRAGGNPLYAEQYARLLEERMEVELALPETVQGIIAGRLDLLPREQKSLLQDAAVAGKLFWLGAVAAISRMERRAAEAHLHALERKGFVRRERETTVEGDTEYSFLHVLVREVAYGQIPRGPRGEKHRLMAEWLESLGRTEDQAEMLAHHYGEALRLSRAARLDATAFEEPARRAFRDAGDRALALNGYATASRFYEQALDFWPEEDRERGSILLRRAQATFIGIDETNSDVFDEARDALLAQGDVETAAQAEVLGALAIRNDGRPLDALDRARGAAARLEDSAASEAKTYVVANLARLLVLVAEGDEGLQVGGAALRMAEELGLQELKAHALNTIGLGRILAGDVAGITELEESLRLALEHGSPFELGRIYNNLEGCYVVAGRIGDASATVLRLIELRERLGLPTAYQRAGLAAYEFVSGHWTEATRLLRELLEGDEANDLDSPDLAGLVARLRFAQDDVAGAIRRVDRSLDLVRGSQQDVETAAFLQFYLGMRAELALAEQHRELAQELVDELLALDIQPERIYPFALIWLSLLLLDLGRIDEWAVSGLDPDSSQPWIAVATAISRGELRDAADRLAAMGARTLEAEVRLRGAARARAEGRGSEADAELQKALAFHRSVGATRYIREGEALLAATG